MESSLNTASAWGARKVISSVVSLSYSLMYADVETAHISHGLFYVQTVQRDLSIMYFTEVSLSILLQSAQYSGIPLLALFAGWHPTRFPSRGAKDEGNI